MLFQKYFVMLHLLVDSARFVGFIRRCKKMRQTLAPFGGKSYLCHVLFRIGPSGPSDEKGIGCKSRTVPLL